jgi:hypothetical protein
MILDDIDVDTFGLLVHWMYQKEIEFADDLNLLQLGKLWVLADRLFVVDLKEDAVAAINKTMNIHKNSEDVLKNGFLNTAKEFFKLAYETEIKSDLKVIAVRFIIDQAPSNLNKWSPELPRKMLEDLVYVLSYDRERLAKKSREKPIQIL